MRVLIDVTNGRVKDELVEALVRAGHVVEKGTASTSELRFDVVVVGSVEVAARMNRENPERPVIVFTRVEDVELRIRALEVGDAVDSGLSKLQIATRIGAASRRASETSRIPTQVELDGCAFDLAANTATREGVTIELTRRELELVRWLSGHPGRVVTAGELLENVWHVSTNSSSRAVEVVVAGLRAKIERDPAKPAIIVSVKGKVSAYRWGSSPKI